MKAFARIARLERLSHRPVQGIRYMDAPMAWVMAHSS